MFMVLSSWQSHCESSPGSFDKCRTAQSGRRPKTKPDDLGCKSACTVYQSLHPPSPFTQTMSHIVESCPLTKLNGGLSRLHSADKDAVSWLTSYGQCHAYEKKRSDF